MGDPYAAYGGAVAEAQDDSIPQPIASVRSATAKIGDYVPVGGQDFHVSGFDSKGRPTLTQGKPPAQSDPYAAYGGKVAANDPYAAYGGKVAGSQTSSQVPTIYNIPPGNLAMTDTEGQLQHVPKAEAGARVQQGWKVGPPQQQPKYDLATDPAITRYVGDTSLPTQDDMSGTPDVSGNSGNGPSMGQTTKQFGKEFLTGLRKMAFYKPSAGESAAHYEPLEGTAGAMVKSGQQAVGQAQQGQYGRAAVSGLSAVDPFAAGPVSQINELEQQGRGKEAAQRGILNAGVLAAGLPKGAAIDAVADVGKSAVGGAADLGQALKIKTAPARFLNSDELMTRTLNSYEPVTKASSPSSIINTHNAIQTARPLIQQAADSMGLKIASAGDALDAIEQAKRDVLQAHQDSLPNGKTVFDLPDQQRAQMQSDIDALNTTQDKLEAAKKIEDAKSEKAAAKGPATKGQAVGQIFLGGGKLAASQAASRMVPFGGTAMRAGMNAAGISSGFSDIAGGLRTFMGKAATEISPLDKTLQQVFPASDFTEASAQRAVNPGMDTQAARDVTAKPPYTPASGDLTVQHSSTIAPPETPHGDAQVIDIKNRRGPLWELAGIKAGRPQVAEAQPAQPNAAPFLRRMQQPAPEQDFGGIGAPFDVRPTTNQGMTIASPDTPGGGIVPTGQHPETIITRALQGAPKARVFATARELGINVGLDDSHSTLIPQIMDKIFELDAKPETSGLIDSLAEHYSGLRGSIPARDSGMPAETSDGDLTGQLQASLEQANRGKARPTPERRTNTDYRSQVDEMSPDARTKAIFFSDKTGLPNYRAFQRDEAPLADSHPHVGYADVDDFKTANTVLGKDAVDTKILPMMGDLFRDAAKGEPGVRIYHRSGDEFVFRADDPAAVTRVVNSVNEQLQGAKFTAQRADGTIVEHTGTGLSHGTGSTEDAAELSAETDKQQRKLQGLRTGARDTAAAPVSAAQPNGEMASSNRPGSQTTESGPTKRQDILSRAADLKPGQAAMVPTSDLRTDPSRFQYKGGTDEAGVTNALKDQRQYDQNKGGVLLVWKDPADGNTYVVNGHHRYELAQRAGEPNVLARSIDAPDADEAKIIGAETNISEGHGSTVDAARYFKAAKISTAQDAMNRNLPLGQAKVKDGLAMARLDSSIIDRVESGKIPEGRAVSIGSVTDSPAQQDAVLQAIAKAESRSGRELNNGEVESIARQVKAAATHVDQGADLFGSFSREQSLFGEQAAIDDYVLKQLASDKRTFGAVSSKTRAETLGKVEGQTINAGENQRISEQAAQAAEIYKRLVNSPGALNDIRTNAARGLAGRMSNPQTIKAQTYSRMRQELMNQLGGSGSLAEGAAK